MRAGDSPEAALMTSATSLTFRNIRFVPIVHRRVTFAEQVRLAAQQWQPDLLAVELPATMQMWIEEGIERLPEISAVCWEEPSAPGAMQFLPIDPCDGLIEAVRIGLEHQLPVAYIDLDLPGVQEPYVYAPDDLIIDKNSLERYVDASAYHLATSPDDARSLPREAHMARCLRELAGLNRPEADEPQPKRVLCVLGIGHYLRVRQWVEHGIDALPQSASRVRGLRERSDARLVHVAPDSLTQVLGEMPYLTWIYEQAREGMELTGVTRFDKLAAVQGLMRDAEHLYEQTYKERISPTQWRGMLQYLRNLALVGGRLRPDLYEVVCAARGMVDGDYGWEVYELARSYPPQNDRDPDLPMLEIKGVRGHVEGREERFRMQPRWESAPTETLRMGFRRRPPRRLRQLWKALWEQEFSGSHICSWPPEDEVQERFMDYVRKRALQFITEDRRQVQEFTTSLLDGLDIRETMRNWHRERLYVQQTPQPRGHVE